MAVLTVGSTEVKTPQKMKVGIYDISSAQTDRNAEGLALIDRVATKRKLEMEWGPLTNTEISTLLSAVTAVTFSVTYPDPQTGANKTITCYCGDRTSPMLKYNTSTSEPMWEGLKMNFIEQ